MLVSIGCIVRFRDGHNLGIGAMMISRRDMIVAGSAFIAPTAGAPGATAMTMPAPGRLRFDVLRNDSRIGQHTVTLTQDGAVLRASIRVDIAVSLGPIVLYRYTHSVQEIWRDGRFVSLESETNDDGTRYRVVAERRADGVTVNAGNAKDLVLPAETIPLTHWHQQCMVAPLFHPQTGERLAPSVALRGEETIALADGRMVRANRYSLTGDVALDDWYDTARTWTALRSVGRDGSMIAYRRAG